MKTAQLARWVFVVACWAFTGSVCLKILVFDTPNYPPSQQIQTTRGKPSQAGCNKSRYCTDVHAGNCRPGTCGGGAAFGPWQVEPRNREDGKALVGLDQEATDRSAAAAAKILSRSWQCGGHPRGWFTAYAGRKCGTDWKTLEQRVATYWRVASGFAAKGNAA